MDFGTQSQMLNLIFGNEVALVALEFVTRRADEAGVMAGGHPLPAMGLISGLAQMVWLQVRGKPVAGLQWLGWGLVLGFAVWGTFVSAIPAALHMAAAIVSRAVRSAESLTVLTRHISLNREATPPTSLQASGEPRK